MSDFKSKIDEIMQKEGNIRGEIILSHLKYIEKKEGPDAVSRIQKTLEELGYTIDFSSIKSMGWQKVSLGTAVGILAKELFDWTNDDIIEMGKFTPKVLIMNKLFFRHFVSIESCAKMGGSYWEKICDVGKLTIKMQKNNQIIIQLSDYDTHPIDCLFISGYLYSVFNLCTKNEIKIKEEKCLYKGDPFHQFLIEW